jgi:hypothetical protein
MTTYSRPRTLLLLTINDILGRGRGDRSYILCGLLKPHAKYLLNAGVKKYKVELVLSIPDNILICICRLAECCNLLKECPVCEAITRMPNVIIGKWLEQTIPKIYTIIENGVIIGDVTINN